MAVGSVARVVMEPILLGALATYLIVVALIWGRRWEGQAPVDVLARYDGEVVTIGHGTDLLTERTGRLVVDRWRSSLSLRTDERVWPIRLGDVRWLVDPKTGARMWLKPTRRRQRPRTTA